MRPTSRRRRAIHLFAPVLAAALFVASPAPRHVAAVGCGENSGPVCKKNESCAWFIFVKICTTKYDYYPTG